LGQWCPLGTESEGRGAAVHAQQVERTTRALQEEGGKPAGERKARREWEAKLKACFPGAERQAAVEWRTGRVDRVASARGARVVCVVDRERSVHTFGGEACFLKRREKSFVSARGDGDAFRVGRLGRGLAGECARGKR